MNDKLNTNQTSSWLNQIPNILTVIRIILVPVFVTLIVSANQNYFSVYLHSWALAVFCLAAYTDRLDGQLARKWNLISNFGKIVDPIADKALMISAFVLLSWYYSLYWWFTFLVIFRELAVTVLRMVLLRRAIVVPASKGGKIKTALQCLLVFLWMIFVIFVDGSAGTILAWSALVTLVATFVATALSGLVYFLDAWSNYRLQKSSSSIVEEPLMTASKSTPWENTDSIGETIAEDVTDVGVEKSSHYDEIEAINPTEEMLAKAPQLQNSEALISSSVQDNPGSEKGIPAEEILVNEQEIKKYAPRAKRRLEEPNFELRIPGVSSD